MHANHAIRSLAILLLMTTVATCPAWAVNSTRITEFAAGYPRSTTGRGLRIPGLAGMEGRPGALLIDLLVRSDPALHDDPRALYEAMR